MKKLKTFQQIMLKYVYGKKKKSNPYHILYRKIIDHKHKYNI